MCRNILSKPLTKRILSIFLSLALLCSALVLGLSAIPDPEQPLIASGVSPASAGPGGTPPFPEAFNMLADADTSNATFFQNIEDENGRIWTDKSVNLGRAFIYDTAGNPVDSVTASAADEFLVTLSALSQAFTLDALVEPSDTVFVIDISGSMASNQVPGTGRTRIAVLVDALNMAIDMLMEANPNNRIAVVAYGGHQVSGQNVSNVVPILQLGHYSINGEADFTQTPMKYLRFGLYACHIPHFYGEEIKYYFQESIATGSL